MTFDLGLCDAWCDIRFVDKDGQQQMTYLRCQRRPDEHDKARRVHRAEFLNGYVAWEDSRPSAFDLPGVESVEQQHPG